MIIVLLERAFLFFVLTSDRPLPVTTIFVFSKPLCSADRDSGISCTAAKALFIAVKGLSTAAKICDCCSLALLQLFCRTSWSHSAALQQPCSFRMGQQLRCKTAAESFKEPLKAAQRFCIPLQLEWSCCLASKRLLNSCNLAVQLFWNDFVELYSAASFIRASTLLPLHDHYKS